MIHVHFLPVVYIKFVAMAYYCANPLSLCVFVTFGLTDPMEGYQGSPYPEIDNFVRSLVNKDGLQGGKETTLLFTNECSAALFLKNLKIFFSSGIRQWSYFSLKELLIYDISGYRWCENIGRAHKSNNIMYVL